MVWTAWKYENWFKSSPKLFTTSEAQLNTGDKVKKERVQHKRRANEQKSDLRHC